ncbi:MAG: methyltransferase [Bacteroidota bacterium]
MSTQSFSRRVFSRLLLRYAETRIYRTDNISLLGFRLIIPPTVFHPALFFSSKILGRYVAGMPLSGKRVLDMGSGSGIIGLCAARAGANVLAVDRNQAAVSATQMNIEQNNFSNRISVCQSDLFDSIPVGDRFDWIIWNPPFYPKVQTSDESLAWNAGENYETISRFAIEVRNWLDLNGSVLLILSSDVDEMDICKLFKAQGFTVVPLSSSRRLFERLTIYQFN